MRMRRFVAAIALAAFAQSCSQVPKVAKRVPWMRTLPAGPVNVPLGAAVTLTVQGETSFLPGADHALIQEIRGIVSEQLQRKGYGIDEEKAPFELSVNYRSTLMLETSSGYSMLAGGAIVPPYAHSLTIRITATGARAVWAADSTWQSDCPDILLTGGALVLREFISMLPSKLPALPVAVPAVEKSHGVAFFRLKCLGKVFACPAITAYIAFPRSENYRFPDWEVVPRAIEDHRILAAVVDLVSHAAEALPCGHGDWSNPLDQDLWSKALLGGSFLLASDKAPTPVLVRLDGREDSYVISRAWVPSAEEYASFEERLRAWQDTRAKYYDFYEH